MSAPAKTPKGKYGQTWSATNPEPGSMRKVTARYQKEAAYVVRVFRSDNGYTGELRQLVDLSPVWGPPLLTTRTYKTTRAAWSALTRAFTNFMLGGL